MKPILILAALALCACKPEQGETGQDGAVPATEPLPAQAPASKPPAVVPRPADQAKLDDMILAGYTPHADHLHAPGVNECPLTKGNDAVM